MNFKWTTEKPASSGWYWWQGEEHTEGEIIEVYIKASDDAKEVRAWLTKDEVNYPVSAMRGQFAGPIPEPTA